VWGRAGRRHRDTCVLGLSAQTRCGWDHFPLATAHSCCAGLRPPSPAPSPHPPVVCHLSGWLAANGSAGPAPTTGSLWGPRGVAHFVPPQGEEQRGLGLRPAGHWKLRIQSWRHRTGHWHPPPCPSLLPCPRYTAALISPHQVEPATPSFPRALI
jgi:hypothetical protein